LAAELPMKETKLQASPIRFGIFEVDLQAGELRRQGFRVKLQEQPFQVLLLLLDRPGEAVTREDLQRKLWAADTFVDFERGLNRAINKLREALFDNADNPRFIETLPRRGYRFIAPVETAGVRETEVAERSRLLLVPTNAQVADHVSTHVTSEHRILPWTVAGVLAVILVIGFWRPWSAAPILANRPLLQLDLDVGPDEFLQPAISPDGMRIVFVSKGALAMRRLDQTKITRIAGTEGGSLPFFSPNGQWIAFFAARKLQKVPVEGGSPVVLCDAPSHGGGSWGDDNNIVAGLDQGLSRIPAAGGAPQPLTNPKSNPPVGLIHLWPQVLPGSKGVLFAATNGSAQGSLRILTPLDGKIRTIVENSTYGRYLPGGYLVYYRQGTLFAAPIDATRLELKGPAVPLVRGVSTAGGLGRAEFDLSWTGTLVYRGGTAGNTFELSWLYASGKTEPLLPTSGSYLTPRLSPDGGRVALSVIQDGKQNLRVYDLIRKTWNRLTFEAAPDLLPTWTPDGEFLAFQSGKTLAWKRSDGSGSVEHLVGPSPHVGPWSFSADGKWLAFWPLQPGSDLWVVPVERSPGVLRLGQPRPLLQQAGSKGAPAISPDDRWLAYTSDESGIFEIYVIPFSPQGIAAGGKWAVSSGGGTCPVWSHSGELFYQNPQRQIQVAAYSVRGDSFHVEKSNAWSEVRLGDTGIFPAFDVAPDGRRVVALLAAEDPRTQSLIRVQLNVDSELRRLGPSPGR
jgi:eukaryotic-like serine/threonine-protein kinase